MNVFIKENNIRTTLYERFYEEKKYKKTMLNERFC